MFKKGSLSIFAIVIAIIALLLIISILFFVLKDESSSMDDKNSDSDRDFNSKGEDKQDGVGDNIGEVGDFQYTPGEVTLLSENNCEYGRTCYTVGVNCNNLPERKALVRVKHNEDSKGTIILTTGGLGTGVYGNPRKANQDIVDTLIENGYETFEVAWQGEHGWAEGSFGEGFKNVMCAYADVVKYISRDLANNNEVMCSHGNSGGSMQIAYGLTLYDLEEYLDLAILSGGPPTADSVDICRGIVGADETMNWVMGYTAPNNWCSLGLGDDLPDNIVLELEKESIVSEVTGELRDFLYPKTKVAFIEGGNDQSNANRGLRYYDAITTSKSWIVLPGVGHSVHKNDDGAAAIIEEFLGNCVE
jgi:hypothetical protein